MKKILFILLWYLLNIELIFAEAAWWVFWSWVSKENVRQWNIHMEDIPKIIRWAIDLLLSIAWTITIIFIIIWAYKILFGSLTSEKTKWKDTIIMALTWFAISALAWFIIKFLIDNLA